MSLRNLFVSLGVEIEGKEKVEKLDKDIKSLTKTVQGYGAAWAGQQIIRGIRSAVSLFEQIVQGANQLKYQADMLGLSTKELQNYQAISQIAGVDARQTAVAFRFFNRAVGEAAFGTKSAVKVFGQLGVQIKDANGKVKPTGDLLAEVSDKLLAIPNSAQRTAVAMRLLGRGGAALLPVLSMGSVELKKFFQQLEDVGEGFDSAFIQKSQHVVTLSGLLARGWKTMASALGNEVLPYVIKYLDNSIKSIKTMVDFAKHTYAIRTALMALASILTTVLLGYLLLNPPLLAMVAIFTALAAAVTAVYLAFDDFYTFLEGGGSVIGDWLDDQFGPGAADTIRAGILDALNELKAALGLTGDAGESMADKLTNFFADHLPDLIKGGIDLVFEFVKALNYAAVTLQNIANSARYFAPSTNFSDFGKIHAAGEEIDRKSAERMAAFEAARGKIGGLLSHGPGKKTEQEREDAYARGANDEIPQTHTQADEQVKHVGGNPFSMPAVNVEITVHGNGKTDPNDIKNAARDGVQSGIKDAHQRARDAYDTTTQGHPDGLVDPLTTFAAPSGA